MDFSGPLKPRMGWILAGLGGFLVLWLAEPVGLEWLRNSQKGELPEVIRNLYPQLSEKLNAFGPERMAGFLTQIKFRWLILVALGGYLFAGTGENRKWISDEKSLIWRIRLFFALSLVYLPDLMQELNLRQTWKAFYQPLPLFAVLFPEFPPMVFLQFAVLFVFGAAAYLVVAKWKFSDPFPFWLALAGLGGWTILLSVFFGFGKIDHTYASLYSAYLFLVIWLHFGKQYPDYASLGFRVFQAGIWGCYFFAGLEKLLLSGFSWMSDDHFQTLARLHPEGLAHHLVSIPGLGTGLLAGAWAFQLLAFLQWRFPKWGYVTFGTGIAFHLGTWILLDVGGWQSPWIPMLFFLLPAGKKSEGSPTSGA